MLNLYSCLLFRKSISTVTIEVQQATVNVKNLQSTLLTHVCDSPTRYYANEFRNELEVNASHSIDSKIDDGEPGTGMLFVARGSGNPNGAWTNKNATQARPVTYIFSDTDKNCRLFFLLEK
jgi:hypothetical protein